MHRRPLIPPPPTPRAHKNAATWALLSQGVLTVALCLPFMTISGFDGERSYSILGSVFSLIGSGEWFLALLIFAFSVVFPVAKNCLLLAATSGVLGLPPAERAAMHRLAASVAKYSMLDVFVVAILIVILKIGDQATVTIGSGTILFCAAVGMSILASASMRTHKERP